MNMIHLKKWIKGEYSFSDIVDYFRGTIRYYLYYTKGWNLLIRKHIREQIDLRIRMMDTQCYQQGSCKLCGCKTTALQMANKPCEKPCYPPMMNKFDWKYFQREYGWYKDIDTNTLWVNKNDDETPLKDVKLIMHT